MMNPLRRAWRFVQDHRPVQGFHFDRPLVLFQSDDWGRIGVRDQDGFEQLRSAGITLGDRPYDLYSLETAADLSALSDMLHRHSDSAGRHPCIEMNFVVANLDFEKMADDPSGSLQLLALSDGLPRGWERPSLLKAYRVGIADGVFCPALHGSTHFCRDAVERYALDDNERGKLLRIFWKAGTPYIYWRMPWIGYEYWDPEKPPEEQFLPVEEQGQLIGQTVGGFAKLFSTLPHSACAPGYRANDDTHRAWAQHGVCVAQNGPGMLVPPFFGRYEMLHLTRNIEFEPAVNPACSVEECLQRAERCFERGLPAIVSVHSINFHSTLRDFRSGTLKMLDKFLLALEEQHPDLLYLHDQDLHNLVTNGCYELPQGSVQVNVRKETFTKTSVARLEA